MLSRVAESIYWMARYIERAENTARFIDVSLNMSLDAPIAVLRPMAAPGLDHRQPRGVPDIATREPIATA